jgi:hypothetical protein
MQPWLKIWQRMAWQSAHGGGVIISMAAKAGAKSGTGDGGVASIAASARRRQ